jgi:hypothetical protein
MKTFTIVILLLACHAGYTQTVGLNVLQTSHAQNQGDIPAGAILSDDSLYSVIYHNIADTTIRVRFMGGSNIEEHFYDLDLNGDGKNDFSLHLQDVAAVGAGSAIIELLPLDSNLIAIDTAVHCSYKTIDTINFGDTIGQRNTWYDKKAVFYYLYWFPNSGGYCGNWKGQNDKFAGLGLKSNGDTIYGWARISLQQVDVYLAVTLRDFAVKVRKSLGISPVQNQTVDIFPNPSTGVFWIKSAVSLQRLKIFTSAGIMIRELDLDPNNPSVDLLTAQKGMYMLRLEGISGIYFRKVVVY